MDLAHQFRKLECPFTWNFEDILDYGKNLRILKIETDEEPEEEEYSDNETYYESHCPLSTLLYFTVRIYSAMVLEKSEQEKCVLHNIKRASEFLIALKNRNDPEISVKVANHIFLATQYFAYKNLNMVEKESEVLSEIEDVQYSNKKDQSTLYGCKSLSILQYHGVDMYKPECFIQDAIKENPNCHLWYFVQATTLRRKRRNWAAMSTPTVEEIASLKKAYDLSPNLMYEVHIAQMYRELKDCEKSKEIYEHVFNQPTNDNMILLRLALGFIRLKNFEKAKKCFERIDQRYHKNSTYVHYMAIFYYNQQMYEDALPYYEKASKKYNVTADRDFLRCLVQIDKSISTREYLLNLLKKYECYPKEQVQPFVLDLSLWYWRKENNFKKALDFLLQAIQMNQDAVCFINYFDYLNIGIRNNIIVKLSTEFLPRIKRLQLNKDPDYCQKVIELENFCNNALNNVQFDNPANKKKF